MLGPCEEWLVEWKWDGIRAQLIQREGQVFLWSRGEELITERFPEIAAAARTLPRGTVLDGEILAFENDAPRPFADLQQRIGRQRKVREVAADVPAVFLAYDLLEWGGEDIRAMPLGVRRARLVDLVTNTGPLRISEEVGGSTWEALALRRDESRARHVEGLMLKRWSSPYRPGRRRGDWWKWKIDPFTVDAVLIYAQPGSGRRASLFTDYTFGVWDGDELVPVAKAYSGLSDEEIDEVDRWVRRHTIDAIRTRERGGAGPCVRARFRADRTFDATQVGCRRTLSADSALASRQAAARGRYARLVATIAAVKTVSGLRSAVEPAGCYRRP